MVPENLKSPAQLSTSYSPALFTVLRVQYQALLSQRELGAQQGVMQQHATLRRVLRRFLKGSDS